MGEDSYTHIKFNLLFRGYKESELSTEYILILVPN
jgi:hypothetical protein